MNQRIENKNNEIKNQLNIAENNAPINLDNKKILKSIGTLPIPPNFFIGRNGSADKIHELLIHSNNSMLLVYGQGGIGKTSLVSHYYFQYLDFYSHLIWLVPQNGIKETLISLGASLKIKFDKKTSDDERLSEIITTFADLKGTILLIIDNANNIEDLNSNYKFLRQFRNAKIIITSRIETYQNVETLKVEKLDIEYADRLFKYYYRFLKNTEQEILYKLLQAIDYNTLVIEVLAKNLNKFNNDLSENYPIQKLLDDIQLRGLLKISKSTDLETDYIFQNAKPEDIIRSMYDIYKITKEEKEILSAFALIPNIPISLDDLNFLLPKIVELDIKLLSLNARGWIDFHKESKKFKIHSIIAEIVRENVKYLTNSSKRIFDIFFSVFGILSIYPWLLPLIAILIKLESKGPVFYRWARTGLKDRSINIYKFRTFKLSNGSDHKITKVGAFLRNTGLDAAPQLLNILFGDMSCVGPYPLHFKSDSTENLVKNVKGYAKPGLTSLYDVSKKNGYSNLNELILERVKCDIKYIQNWSLLLDFKILLKSVRLIFITAEEPF